MSAAIPLDKIAAIKAKWLAKKRATIKVVAWDDNFDKCTIPCKIAVFDKAYALFYFIVSA